MKSAKATLIGVVHVCVGLFMVLLTLGGRDSRLSSHAAGHVTGFQRGRCPHPIVAFRDESGSKVEITSPAGWLNADVDYPIGTNVGVLYDPLTPGRVDIPAFDKAGASVNLPFGLLFMCSGAFAVYRGSNLPE